MDMLTNAIHQSPRGFASQPHDFIAKTKVLVREIAPATQASETGPESNPGRICERRALSATPSLLLSKYTEDTCDIC